MASSTAIAGSSSAATKEEQQEPRWCPEQQIFIGGVPGASDVQVQDLLRSNGGYLRVFGYGSLCWKAGGTLSKPGVTPSLGHARGYRRTWAQRSTDHRGNVDFPGIVCTLLKASEVQAIDSRSQSLDNVMTEGTIYLVPPELAKECLAELDFREKGGYAREIIEVVEDETNQTVQTLLYRGTPDNPAFWPRLVTDLPLAAAVMAVSVGPSGPNDVYLNQLDDFLKHTPSSSADYIRHDDTTTLASMTQSLQQQSLYFLYGAGSNQHGQILQEDFDKDEPQLAEGVLVAPKTSSDKGVDPPQHIYAGGGHSGLLTKSGKLYLWGWNETGQCGGSSRSKEKFEVSPNHPFPIQHPLPDIQVEAAALGFSHTLVIERESKKLFAFGDNSRGQVDGSTETEDHSAEPKTPQFIQNDQFVDIAAGLFHSAGVTTTGELVTFGCGRKGQCIHTGARDKDDETLYFGRWKPEDGSNLVQVSCGRLHTAVLDDKGRVWTFGDNKHGQLGRSVVQPTEQTGKVPTFDPVPRLVDGNLGKDEKCVGLYSGWSHVIARVRRSTPSGEEIALYGWGRNDKGQLAFHDQTTVDSPRLLDNPVLKDMTVSCGSESTYFWNAKSRKCYCCGWNEHGNLAIGRSNEDSGDDVYELKEMARVRTAVVSPPTYSQDQQKEILLTAGGAHLLVMMT